MNWPIKIIKSRFGWMTMISAVIISVPVAILIQHDLKSALKKTPDTSITVLSLKQVLEMPAEELARQDIAAVNLACAEGLHGADDLDVQACLKQLDVWADSAARLLKERESRYHTSPAKSNYSINRWRCGGLVQFLNQINGVSYNPSLRNKKTSGPFDTVFYHDSRDFLIHGLILEKKRGTCASMPVLFAAVGRRMGYPIKLVTTRTHLFARWDDPVSGERFNIEVTDRFAEFKSDDFYRTFPAVLNPGEEERQGYLRSLTAQEELLNFLHLRGLCLWNHGRLIEARDAFVASMRRRTYGGWVCQGFIDEVNHQIMIAAINNRR